MKTFIITLILTAFVPVAASLAASTDTNSPAVGLYKTIVNESAGQFALVDTNREIVTLYDKTDRVVWTTNIVMALKTAPVLGERKIHGLSVYQGQLWANVGRGYGIIDIKTGDFKGFAQD
jgi:hypothetical protein